MKTIGKIKEECIAIDITNIGSNGFESEREVIAHYTSIDIKTLLKYYSNYMGLKCLISDGESLTEHGYTLDILDLVDNL